MFKSALVTLMMSTASAWRYPVADLINYGDKWHPSCLAVGKVHKTCNDAYRGILNAILKWDGSGDNKTLDPLGNKWYVKD